MKKSTWIIFAGTAILCILFYQLSMLAYPRVAQWLLAGVGSDQIVVTDVVDGFYAVKASLFIAASAFLVGVGVFFAHKNKGTRNAVKVVFILLDVSVLAVLGSLAFLKYRLMGMVGDYSEMLVSAGGAMSISLEEVRLYEVGLLTCLVVGVCAWIFSKKKSTIDQPLVSSKS